MGTGTAAVQDVAISSARDFDDAWVGMAFLADGPGSQMGAAGDWPGHIGISGLDPRNETMAVCS
jgi:hypothetical protein